MNKELINVLELVKENTTAGIELFKNKFPLVCSQILKVGLYSNIAFLVGSIIGMIIFTLIILYIQKKFEDESLLLFLIFNIIPLGIICINIYQIILIVNAPDLYLVNCFLELLNK